MPVKRCNINGKPGYRFGDKGTCYPYTPGDSKSEMAARQKATMQGQAIKARQGKDTSTMKKEDLAEFKAIKDAAGTYTIPSVPVAELGNIRGYDANEKWAGEVCKNFKDIEERHGYLHRVHEGHNEPGKPPAPTKCFMTNLRVDDLPTKDGKTVKAFFADYVKAGEDFIQGIKEKKFFNRSIEFNPQLKRLFSLAVGPFTPHFKLPQMLDVKVIDSTLRAGDEDEVEIWYSDQLGDNADTVPEDPAGSDPAGQGAEDDAGDDDKGHDVPIPNKDLKMDFEKLYEKASAEIDSLKEEAGESTTKLEELTGQVETLTEERDTLKGEVTKLEEKIANAAAEAHTANVESFLAENLRRGRTSPAERDHLVKLSETAEGFETVKAMVEGREDGFIVPLDEVIADPPDEDEEEKLDEDARHAQAVKLAAEKGITVTDALMEIGGEIEVPTVG